MSRLPGGSSLPKLLELRWASCWRILAFTRNPSLGAVLIGGTTHQTPQKAVGFRDFLTTFRPSATGQRFFKG
jgi:hypothetical protein